LHAAGLRAPAPFRGLGIDAPVDLTDPLGHLYWMRAIDLDFGTLLDIDARGGAIRFAGERVLILDTGAMGLLRKQLVDLAGCAAARAVLMRFGFAHGVRMAEAMTSRLPWDNDAERRDAGGILHMLQGFMRMAPGSPSPLSSHGAVLESSFEAEQHLLHLGLADEPVCWMLSGVASGYMSRTEGEQIYVREDRCVGKGDPFCRFRGQTISAWGGSIKDHVPLFREGGLDAPLHELIAWRTAVQPGPNPAAGALAEGALMPSRAESFPAIIAESPIMRAALDLARRVAPVDSTVLLIGESGAGKELVARLIHDESARAGGPFVAVNCAAIAEALLESELFGHARGSFTGATHDRAGLFEAASGGTLFLDEVGEIPPSMQAKLLRVLQERQVRRVGENRSRPVDARILAATNRDLTADASAGRFRKDLYYRLRVVEIRLPPLRERREDILPLARALLAAASRRLGRPLAGFTPRAIEALERHAWPGNVRELENTIERAVALARGDRADLADLPEDLGGVPSSLAAAAEGVRTLKDIEREAILAAIERNGGNQTRAALELGIGPSTLYRKLKGYAARTRGTR